MNFEGDGGEATDVIGYKKIAHEAFSAAQIAAKRSIMRQALLAAKGPGGLPGQHHFYITFHTRAPGVAVADVLKDRFPDEMTIVIQHQFWDLEVHRDFFEVVLRFGGVPQHLRVPYNAVTRFLDPSVRFAIEFDDEATFSEADAEVFESEDTPDDEASAPDEADAPATGSVVSLDAFRRK